MRFIKLMVSLSSFTVILAATALFAQQPAIPLESGLKNWTTQQDHQNMMMQLGIRKLRPGPNADANAPNPANYDESLANPFPNLPEVLTLKNGEKVTTAEMWWEKRRPEIVEDFEREVLGRIPPNVPKVAWEVIKTTEANVGTYPVVGKQLVGHVDNSAGLPAASARSNAAAKARVVSTTSPRAPKLSARAAKSGLCRRVPDTRPG